MKKKFYKVLLAAGVVLPVLYFLPVSWVRKCVDVCLRAEVQEVQGSRAMPLQVFYSLTGEFSEPNSRVKFVAKGRHTVRFRLPVDELRFLRIDFGNAPAVLKVSPVEICGGERQTYAWRADLPRVQIGKWEVDPDGNVLCEVTEKDPHVILRLNRPVKARWAVNWPVCILWGIIAGFVVVKLSRAITPVSSLIADNGRVFAFDVLRVAALLTIFVSHVFDIGKIPRWIHSLGVCGLTVFVVLSGAGLMLSNKSSPYWMFVKKRFASILPPYWVAYLLMTSLVFMSSRWVSCGMDPLRWLLTLSGMDGFLALQIPGVYEVVGGWYVGFTLLLYLLAPFVLKGVERAPILTVIIVCVLSGVAFLMHDVLCKYLVIVNPRIWWNPLIRLPEFTFGCVFARYILGNRKRLLASAACAIPVLAASLFIQRWSFFCYSHVSIAGFIAIFVIICACFEFIQVDEPAKAIISFLSKHSFAVYLVHAVVYSWIFRWRPKFANYPEDLYVILALISALLISYVLAWLISGPADLVKRFVFGTVTVRNSGR